MPIPEKIPREITFRETLRGTALTFRSTWGLFSPEHIDDGTRLLLENVSVQPTDTILDVGCGYGAIGLTLVRLVPCGRVHLIDKDFVAVEYAKRNARENDIANVDVYLSNGFSRIPKTLASMVSLPISRQKQVRNSSGSSLQMREHFSNPEAR